MADKWISVNIGGKVIWKNTTTGDVSETQPAPPAKRIRIRKPKADAEPTLAEVLSGEADVATDGGGTENCELGSAGSAKRSKRGARISEFDDPLS